jgi:hypothetical protein
MRLLGFCECYSIMLPHRTYSPSTVPQYVLIECVLTGSRPYVSGDQAAVIPKVAAQDTTLAVDNVNGGKTSFPVPSGTQIVIHVHGLHYNRTLNGFVR